MAALRPLEPVRTPLALARNALSMAEADLNGFVARIAAGNLEDRRAARAALDRVTHARHELDRVRFAAMEVDTVNGRPLCTNDPDDMSTALITALERIEERPRADLNAGLALGPSDCLPKTVSAWA